MQEEGKKVFYEQLRDTGTDTNAIYTEIAQDWDSIMDKFGDVMCSELVKLIEARFPQTESRSSLLVYEVGVGTGRMAELLLQAGFGNIIGVEPCEALLKIAEKKQFYKDLKMRYCGTGELESQFIGKFDLAVGAGVFAKNHIPPSGLEELYESLKKGGVAAFPARIDQWEELGYREKAETMEKEGKWALVAQIEKENWVKSDTQKKYKFVLYEKKI